MRITLSPPHLPLHDSWSRCSAPTRFVTDQSILPRWEQSKAACSVEFYEQRLALSPDRTGSELLHFVLQLKRNSLLLLSGEQISNLLRKLFGSSYAVTK